ncbi:preprotein translocase subunit SecY [Candidatus Wolfebacteria bacterium]|nr:MAG: preprotein translocase subunit SecY [Candidatus Wolfebacteria bacterium]
MNFGTKIKLIVKDAALRKQILFVLGALIVFRFMAVIPIPGVDVLQLEQFFANNEFLGLLNIFSGGGLANLSLVMLGVGPYITATIIMQLTTMISPSMREMYHEEGAAGKKKFTTYSRWLTVPLALLQSFAFLMLLTRSGVVGDLSALGLITNVLVISTGSILLMWIGELMSEFGIGNGVSLIIFAGIVASIPSLISQRIFAFDPSQLPLIIGFLIFAVLTTAAVVAVTEAERPIPITYAKQVRGNKVYGGVSTYLPLRVNQAGVIPIIFALSLMLFPQMVLSFLANVNSEIIATISAFILEKILGNGWIYAGLYFILVFLFTYFYTAVTFDPENIAKNLQRSGAFIPGVRPGQSTSAYIGKIITRITLVGALFLGVIAVMPIGMQAYTGNAAFAVGGTGLLIAVSVVIDLIKKVEAQISMREY